MFSIHLPQLDTCIVLLICLWLHISPSRKKHSYQLKSLYHGQSLLTHPPLFFFFFFLCLGRRKLEPFVFIRPSPPAENFEGVRWQKLNRLLGSKGVPSESLAWENQSLIPLKATNKAAKMVKHGLRCHISNGASYSGLLSEATLFLQNITNILP